MDGAQYTEEGGSMETEEKSQDHKLLLSSTDCLLMRDWSWIKFSKFKQTGLTWQEKAKDLFLN